MRDVDSELEDAQADAEMFSAQADEAFTRLARQEVLLPAFRRFRHVKTKEVYELLLEGMNEADQTEMVVYRNFVSGRVWIRPKATFFDGRFEEL